MNANTVLVLAALRDNVEYEFQSQFRPGTWGAVYLDNAKPRGMTHHQFAGYLSTLEGLGLYQQHGDDGCFGAVRIED